MPTFIKPGFWNKKKYKLNGELDLDKLIQTFIPPTTSTTTTQVPYKVYTALLSQSGIALSPPSAIELENTLGFSPVWFANSVGQYFTQNAEFNTSYLDKVTVITTPINRFGKSINLEAYANVNTNGIWLISKNGASFEDGLLSIGTEVKTTIEIRVYN
jgi:hypothetical protein